MTYDLACTITGAAGFVGSHLCRALLEQEEYSIRVFAIDVPGADWSRIDRQRPTIGSNHLSFHEWDVMQPIRSDFLAVDAIYHFAGIADPKRYLTESIKVMDLNLKGLTNILERIVLWSSHRPRIVYSSTSEVYGLNEDVPFSERDSDHTFGPTYESRWCYALSKLVGEHYLKAYSREQDVRHTIFRFFNLVGDDIDAPGVGRVLTQMVASALERNTIFVTEPGTQTRCFTHIDEAVVPLVRALTMKKYDPPWLEDYTINLGSDEEISMIDLAYKVAHQFSSNPKVKVVPPDTLYGPGYADVIKRKPAIKEAERVFGWRAQRRIDDWLPGVVRSIASR